MSSPESIHPAARLPADFLADCDVRFQRRSGPGGQNRNKVETAAILTHRPSGLSAEANERRTQGENREAALFRLRLLLALEVRLGGVRSPDSLWKARCRGGKILINPGHDDFPAILARALDVLDGLDWDVKAAAEALGCSTTQLVKLIKEEPRAMTRLNREREGRGLPGLC